MNITISLDLTINVNGAHKKDSLAVGKALYLLSMTTKT